MLRRVLVADAFARLYRVYTKVDNYSDIPRSIALADVADEREHQS